MFALACSRLSGSGEDAKVKGTRKVGEAKKRKRNLSQFIGPNYLEPRTGYVTTRPLAKSSTEALDGMTTFHCSD